MVVCKYFMEGACAFGSRCKYDHIDPYRGYDATRPSEFSQNDRPVGISILKGGNTSYQEPEFSHSFIKSTQQITTQQKVTHGQKYNIQEMMQIISRDIVQSEKGNQWPLSSYSPGKDLNNIPGLEDYSPEELRWECYKAAQSNTLPLWQVLIQQLYANVAKVNNDLKKKDTGYAIVERWLREREESIQASLHSSFGGGTAMMQGFSSAHPETHTSTNTSFSFALPQQQIQSYTSSSSIFANSQTTVLPTSHQNFQPFPSTNNGYVIDNQAYSTTEELSQGELEAFKANRFVLGAIPTKPPPKSLCNL